MILQALYQLAHDEKLMEDPDFEWKPVAWLVLVGEDGRLLGIQGTHHVPNAGDEADEQGGKKGKKPKPRPKNFQVPREPGRTSGDRAFFLFDKAEYALGLDPEPDPAKRRPAEKLASRFALFRERAEACRTATGDEGVLAVCRLLESIASGEVIPSLPEGCASNDLFAFIYAPDVDLLVTSRPKVRDYWRSLRALPEGGPTSGLRCLVSGLPCDPVDKHPGIKNVPGGTTSGVALVSFNSNAFESYGWAGNDNAPVSREAAEACSTALNRLLHPAPPDPTRPGETLPTRYLRLSADTAVCFWSSKPSGDDLTAQLLGLFEGNPDKVRELYRSLWKGEKSGVDDPSAFYALTLSGSQGRAILRDWFESTVKTVDANLAQHFADLAIVRNTPAPRGREHPPALPLHILMRSLALRGDDKSVPAALAGQLIEAALANTVYPFSILQRALERSRAEIGRTDWSDLERRDARAALLKAVLNRRLRFHQATTSYSEIKEAMDPNNNDPGYRLGRLMAVLERMQQLALGDVNASVVDRFFSSASASPGAVFPRLMKNFHHHLRKAQDDEGSARFAGSLKRVADEILAPISSFPPFLPLEQQGLFILGYHHQRHHFFVPKAKKTEEPSTEETAQA